MFSFGFQNAFQRGFEADDEVFFARVGIFLRIAVSAEIDIDCDPALLKSLESAKTVVTTLVDSLVPTGYIRFAPDGA